MKLLIAVLALFAVIGVGSASAQLGDVPDMVVPPSPNIDTSALEFVLKLNQDTTLPSDNITVLFSNVTSDSRCPSDVTCIWQGEVSIQVIVTKENASESIVLGENSEAAIFGKYLIRLLKVEPYPQSTHQIQSDEYIATLSFVKVSQILSPLQQIKSGIAVDKIECKDGLQLIFKTSNGNPVCATQNTGQILIERGWATLNVP